MISIPAGALTTSTAVSAAARLGRAPPEKSGKPGVICSKGIEQATGKLASQIVAELIPEVVIAVLSGPSFAAEIAKKLPAALTLATAEESQGRSLAHRGRRADWPEH